MSGNYFKLYVDSVYNLAATLVVKSSDSATAVNDYIKLLYGDSAVIQSDPTTWKYYMNICGKYHPTDTVIKVTSLDTLEEISFTTANLAIHKATATAYQYGERNYIELVTQYPDMESLILGVLYPADMAKSIAAIDGTILSYNPAMVESNEYTLIEKLTLWIQNYHVRWYNRQFADAVTSDGLYTATFLGILYLNLVPAIMNHRLAACKTNEVHSYHIREYLASHGFLDAYLSALSRKQALFFYRNIAYLERNAGRRETFDWLVEHIMTERGLPLAEYTMKHDDGDMPDSLLPMITFKRKPINTEVNTLEQSIFTLESILGKEAGLAVGNPEYAAEHIEAITNSFAYSQSGTVATKLLDSSMIDYTDATPYTMEHTLLHHWPYLAASGLYSVYIAAKDPRTGDKLSMTATEAFIYAMYLYTKAAGFPLTNIPTVNAIRVQKLDNPNAEEIMRVADTSYVTQEMAQTIVDYQPAIGPVFSTEAFFNQCQAIFNAANGQLGYISTHEHQYRRGLIANMVCQMYSDSVVTFGDDGDLYFTWLSSRNLPSEFTQEEALELCLSLYKEATGVALNTTISLRNLQRAMVSLLSQLSSYSVQFMTEINDSSIKVLNWAAIRMGDVKTSTISTIQTTKGLIEVIGEKVSVASSASFDINYPGIQEIAKLNTLHTSRLEINVKPTKGANATTRHTVAKMVKFGVTITYPADTDGPDNNERVLGYLNVNKLSQEQLLTIPDIYTEHVKVVPNGMIDLSNLITNTNLNVNNYPPIDNNELPSS